MNRPMSAPLSDRGVRVGFLVNVRVVKGFENVIFEQKGCERFLKISMLNKRVVKGF